MIVLLGHTLGTHCLYKKHLERKICIYVLQAACRGARPTVHRIPATEVVSCAPLWPVNGKCRPALCRRIIYTDMDIPLRHCNCVPGAGPICFRPRSHAPVCPTAATIGCSADPTPAVLPHPYPMRHRSSTAHGAGYVPVAVPDPYTTQTLGAGTTTGGTLTGTRPAPVCAGRQLPAYA
jgi:hypothetical protein